MPDQLTAEDFSSLRMQYKNTQAEGEIPTVIEHDFKDGRMTDHYFTVPTRKLFEDEAVKALFAKPDGAENSAEVVIENILFLQQPDGAPWHVLLHEPSMIREVTFEMSCEEFDKLLKANNIILPGEPGFVMP